MSSWTFSDVQLDICWTSHSLFKHFVSLHNDRKLDTPKSVQLDTQLDTVGHQLDTQLDIVGHSWTHLDTFWLQAKP